MFGARWFGPSYFGQRWFGRRNPLVQTPVVDTFGVDWFGDRHFGARWFPRKWFGGGGRIVITPGTPATKGGFYPHHYPPPKPQKQYVRDDLEKLWEGIDPYAKQELRDAIASGPLAFAQVDPEMFRDEIVQRVMQIMQEAEDDEDFLLLS